MYASIVGTNEYYVKLWSLGKECGNKDYAVRKYANRWDIEANGK